MKNLLFLGALCVLAVSAYGLKCYTCEGSDSFVSDGDCGDEYEKFPDQLMMCNDTAGEVWCRKEKSGANNVYTYVERGCTSQCEERNDGYLRRVTCCNTDGCNTASVLSLSVTATIVAAFLQLF